MPPFTDILSVSPDWHIHLTLNLGNFKYLFTDEVYGLSYFYSLKTAFFSTLICLAIGYPMAYAIARTSKSTQSILLLIIILPFWTSFLLRVYALEGIIRETGLLNTALLWLGVIDHPLQIMRTTLRGLPRHRLFLSALHGAAVVRDAREAGSLAARGGGRSGQPARGGPSST